MHVELPSSPIVSNSDHYEMCLDHSEIGSHRTSPDWAVLSQSALKRLKLVEPGSSDTQEEALFHLCNERGSGSINYQVSTKHTCSANSARIETQQRKEKHKKTLMRGRQKRQNRIRLLPEMQIEWQFLIFRNLRSGLKCLTDTTTWWLPAKIRTRSLGATLSLHALLQQLRPLTYSIGPRDSSRVHYLWCGAF